MLVSDLGRLEQVRPRDIWLNEATDFTPWLAQPENLELLGSTLGLELELDSVEKDVGPYRADILCKDIADDTWVVVENQLEKTDHSHLSQILTYAAGLDVVTVVWIATRFTDEHRATVDWFNNITDEDIRFFGIEIEAWKIGDSAVAPRFNVIAKPNDWVKSGGRTMPGGAGDLSHTQALQLAFWHDFVEYVRDQEGAELKPGKAGPRNWMNMPIGRTGFGISAVVSSYNTQTSSYDSGEVRAQVYIGDRHLAKGYFRALENDREAIEAEVGEPLIWEDSPDKASCKVYLRRDAVIDDRDQWPDHIAWLFEKLTVLHRVFRPRILDLEPVFADDVDGPPAAVG